MLPTDLTGRVLVVEATVVAGLTEGLGAAFEIMLFGSVRLGVEVETGEEEEEVEGVDGCVTVFRAGCSFNPAVPVWSGMAEEEGGTAC